MSPKLLLAADMLPEGTTAIQTLEALPGKVPLIRKTSRPPNFETPVSFFNEAFTPNNAFFVRYHLADIPEVDASSWKLAVGGPAAGRQIEFTLDDLKKNFEQVEVAAVCQCSGNRRGFSEPHVPGVEWGSGAMGNARWSGVRLKDLLEKVGLADSAIEIAFDGADGPVYDKTPDFQKSIPAWKAMEENTLVAYEMNGEALPHWNGFPARLIVPGWTGTYWVKHLVGIKALAEALKVFWMNPAYRVPRALFPIIERFTSQEPPHSPSTPITEMVVNSMITNLTDGAETKAGQPIDLKGIAWDGGYGIVEVAISSDGGKSWTPATLGEDLGRFSWRQWSHQIAPQQQGSVTVMVRARNKMGQTQVDSLLFNGAGYQNNVVQTLRLTVA
ncbi:molybdopterin-dependent oxidoreductase [Mycoplana dimorpha]|uniref:DMSO/TMAO reductase YedYZ molybdopterin-dependent catalytic subunit n=1 Tax=Mycoplana dimorpha TaxID=28320 RepID=A0A2T5AM09_MYCDI|nr:molybdopterin-dependent oxidoreductase [Mycoplana dimorpha]PTM87756.1 DMSO/TMAO reductase YedYZ molybdopterin-dependent catalytic subunit [Mycoplana dimorpha]